MAVEAWLLRASEAIWAKLLEPGSYPRNVERLARYGFRVQLQRLSGLSVSLVQEWLRRRSYPGLPAAPDRRLHGCLVQIGGVSVIFLDSGDSPPEQRYTLAHELAHLWLERLAPRERLQQRLGDGVLEAMDGRRCATPAERMGALFSGVSLRPACHLLGRDRALGLVDGGILLAEARADRLALELLAPETEARWLLPGPLPWREWIPAAANRLEPAFEIPRPTAEAYARRLLPPEIGPSFWERFSGAHRQSTQS
jgi:hypothetical protein